MTSLTETVPNASVRVHHVGAIHPNPVRDMRVATDPHAMTKTPHVATDPRAMTKTTRVATDPRAMARTFHAETTHPARAVAII